MSDDATPSIATTLHVHEYGTTILRRLPGDPPYRLFLYSRNGVPMGEVMRGSQAALLLGLGPVDYGDTPAESSPAIVSGPTEHKRAPWFGGPPLSGGPEPGPRINWIMRGVEWARKRLARR